MRRSLRRWFVVLLIAALPAQATLAAGGLWCDSGGAGHASAHALAVESAMPTAADSPASHGHAPQEGGSAVLAIHLHGTCAACAPCCGSLAPPSSPSSDLASGPRHPPDFLPVLVQIRPARPDGVERPPRSA